LDVQKNVLLNGFDSSTEDELIFKLTEHIFFVAPFPVKAEKLAIKSQLKGAVLHLLNLLALSPIFASRMMVGYTQRLLQQL